MFAFGAITCAHSTSSVVSCAQPTMSSLVGSNGGTAPAGWMIVSCGSGAIAGSMGMPDGFETPNVWSNACRSFAIVGEPNESTIAIVWPRAVDAGRVQRGQVVRPLELCGRVAVDADRRDAVRRAERSRARTRGDVADDERVGHRDRVVRALVPREARARGRDGDDQNRYERS